MLRAYDQTETILKDVSTQIFYIGSTHRTASVLKLAVNINISLIALALAEGLVFVRGNEIDPDIFIKIFNSTYFKTGISENKGPKIVNDDYTASFSLTGTGTCASCAKLFSPGTESGTGGTIGGGHDAAKAVAPGQLSTGTASDVAPGHVKQTPTT